MNPVRLPATPANTDEYRLTGVTLIDGTGALPVENATVDVAAGRIAAVYSGTEAPATSAPVYDLTGKFLLPGFIDAHVHFNLNIEAPAAEVEARFPGESAFEAALVARKTLFAGVTTVRDLGGQDPSLRNAVARAQIIGPRMHLALAALSPTGGHTDAHLANGVHSGLSASVAGVNPVVDSDDEVRKTVRTLVRTGADAIKVCATGGVSSPSDTPDDVGIGAHQIAIIVEEMAKRAGQPVAAHAQGPVGIKEAIRGGVSSVEHGYGIDDEGIDLMLEKDTFLVPTLSSALRVPDPALVPDYLYQKKVKWSAIARERVTAAIAAGVKVVTGTDSGICPHGENLMELKHLVSLGMSPLDAITAGTRNAAQLLRLDGDLGTVEAGKLADLVITDVDPLADIAALADPANVRVVLQGGRKVKDTDSALPGLDLAQSAF